jgi:outer membrane immunogenic protein
MGRAGLLTDSQLPLGEMMKGMGQMRITTAAAVALAVGIPSLAYADGMPASRAAVAPPFTWTGFYAGVNVGWGWNDDDKTIILRDGAAFSPCSVPQTSSCGTSIFPSGWFGGGQFGYNWQTGPWVIGVETDIQGADISGDVHHRAIFLPTAVGTDFLNARRDLDWFGTLRGRVGYAFDRALAYVTGGFAYGGVNDRLVVFHYTGGTTVLSRDDTETGYTVGAGIEFAFATNWSAKFEYQHIDLGDERLFDRTRLTALNTTRIDDHLDTFRVGLNYRFGADRGYYAPMK